MTYLTFLYARKSTEEDDRQILSLDAQEKECREYAARHTIDIDEVVREACSARKPGRPLFLAMLKRCEELRRRGRAVRILCHKPDRLLRNIGDWAKLNELMDAGVELCFVSGSYPNNAQGRMVFGINVVFAKYYVDNLSEEVKKGLREKLDRGEWPGWAPLGYRNENGKIVLDVDLAPLVRRAFEYYATGEYSLQRLAEQLYREGLSGKIRGKMLSKSTLTEHLLTNPFYCGLLRYNGQLYPASHEPLISSALFDQVQAQLRRTTQPKRQRHAFRYAGLFTCAACSAGVVGDLKKGRYIYYRCSHRREPCAEGYIRQEDLEAQLHACVTTRIGVAPTVADSLLEAAEALRQEGSSAVGKDRRRVTKQLKDVEQRLATLLDLRLAGHLDDATYSAKRNDLLQAQLQLRDERPMFELPVLNPVDVVTEFVRTCNTAPELLNSGSDEEVRTFLRIVGSNYQLGHGMVDFQPVEPFTLASQVRNRSLWRAEPDEVRTLINAMQKLKSTMSKKGNPELPA